MKNEITLQHKLMSKESANRVHKVSLVDDVLLVYSGCW